VSISLMWTRANMVAGSGLCEKLGMRKSHSSPVSKLIGTCIFWPISVRSEISPFDTSTTKAESGRMVATSFFTFSTSRSARVCHFL